MSADGLLPQASADAGWLALGAVWAATNSIAGIEDRLTGAAYPSTTRGPEWVTSARSTLATAVALVDEAGQGPESLQQPIRDLRRRVKAARTGLETVGRTLFDDATGEALTGIEARWACWDVHASDASNLLFRARNELRNVFLRLTQGRSRGTRSPAEMRSRVELLRRKLDAGDEKLKELASFRNSRELAPKVLFKQAEGPLAAHTTAVMRRPRERMGRTEYGHVRVTGGSACVWDRRAAAVRVVATRRAGSVFFDHLEPLLKMVPEIGPINAFTITDLPDPDLAARLDATSLAYLFAQLREGLAEDVAQALREVGVAQPTGFDVTCTSVTQSNEQVDSRRPGHELIPHHQMRTMVPALWVQPGEHDDIPTVQALGLQEQECIRFSSRLEGLRRERADRVLGGLLGEWSPSAGCTVEVLTGRYLWEMGIREQVAYPRGDADFEPIQQWCYRKMRGGQHAVVDAPSGFRAATGVTYSGILSCKTWHRARHLRSMADQQIYDRNVVKDTAHPLSATPDAEEAIARSEISELSFAERHFTRLEPWWETTTDRAASEHAEAICARVYHLYETAYGEAVDADGALSGAREALAKLALTDEYLRAYAARGTTRGDHREADAAARSAAAARCRDLALPSDRTLRRARAVPAEHAARVIKAQAHLAAAECTAQATRRRLEVMHAARKYVPVRIKLAAGVDECPMTPGWDQFLDAWRECPDERFRLPDEEIPWDVEDVLRDSEIAGLRDVALGIPSVERTPGLIHQAMAAARLAGRARDELAALDQPTWAISLRDGRLGGQKANIEKARRTLASFQGVPDERKEWSRWFFDPIQPTTWARALTTPVSELLEALVALRDVALHLIGAGHARHCQREPLRDWTVGPEDYADQMAAAAGF